MLCIRATVPLMDLQKSNLLLVVHDIKVELTKLAAFI